MTDDAAMAWLADCVDVPVECTACGNLVTLGGWEDDPTEDFTGDLCGCEAEMRIYVGDAPPEVRGRLAMLMDLLRASEQSCDDSPAGDMMPGTNDEPGMGQAGGE